MNVALVAPDGTNTEAGTVRAARLLVRDTLVPPVEAAFERVTVQGVEAEAARLVLLHSSDVITVGAITENIAAAWETPSAAVTVTL